MITGKEDDQDVVPLKIRERVGFAVRGRQAKFGRARTDGQSEAHLFV
jgi:hypothetical protein